MTVRREKEILRYADRRKKREERAVECLVHTERIDGGRRRIGRRWGRDRDRESGTGTGSQGEITQNLCGNITVKPTILYVNLKH